jgi:hypothetical protein
MRSGRPFLGQAAATKGTARLMAESLATSASGLSYSPKVGNPASNLYPGRMIFRPEEVSLYVISFRPGTADTVYIYEIEGPGQGNWKEVQIASLGACWVVSEPESKVIRNMAPTVMPALPAGMDTDVLYPISLLEAAINVLGASFPPEEAFLIGDVPQAILTGMTSAALSSSVLLTEALDGAGIAYDALSIGRKALLLLNHVGVSLLATSLEVLNYVAHGDQDPRNYALASRRVFEASRSFPLFGLYLERAYHWGNLDDFNDQKRLRDQIRVYMSDLAVTADKVSANKGQLVSNGKATQAEIDAAIQTAVKYTDAYWAIDIEYSKLLDSALKDDKLAYEDLTYSAMTIPLLIEGNTKAIQEVQSQAGRGAISTLEGLGAVGGAGKPRIPKEKADRYNKVVASIEQDVAKLETTDPLLYRSFIKGLKDKASKNQVLTGIYDVLTTRIRTAAETAEYLEIEKLSAKSAQPIIEALEKDLDGVKKHVDELSKEHPSQDLLDYAKKAYAIRESIQFLNTEAGNIEPNIFNRLAGYTKFMNELSSYKNTGAKYDSLVSLIEGRLSLLMLPKERGLFYARAESIDFELIARELVDLRNTLRLNDSALRAVMDSIGENVQNMSKSSFLANLADASDMVSRKIESAYVYSIQKAVAHVPGEMTTRAAVIPDIEVALLRDQYKALGNVALAKDLKTLADAFVSSPPRKAGEPVPEPAPPRPMDPVTFTIIKSYQDELRGLEKFIDPATDSDLGQDILDATAVVTTANNNIVKYNDFLSKGETPPPGAEATIADSLDKADTAVKAVSFKAALRRAGQKVKTVLHTIRKIRAATNGTTKLYRFLSEIPAWKTVAVVLGIAGAVLTIMLASLKKADVPFDPKGNTPEAPEGDALGMLTTVGLVAGGLIGGFYLLQKGIPYFKEKFKGWKPFASPISHAPAAAGLSGLPRRRKRKKKPAPKRKAHKRYPGPGKSFMEMM